MTRTPLSAAGMLLSAALLFAAPLSASANDIQGHVSAAFTVVPSAMAGNGLAATATVDHVLADAMETGSIDRAAAASMASSGAGSSAAALGFTN